MQLLTEEVLYKKSPQEITALLYEGIIGNIEESIEYIQQGNLVMANMKLQKANDILERLGVGLKYETGAIAQQLDTLYNYMATKLIEANIKKDTEILENILKLILPIAQAWNTAMKVKTNGTATAMVKKMSAYENSIMRTQNE